MSESLELNKSKDHKIKIDKLTKKGSFKEALDLCNELIKQDPTDADYLIKLGDLYLEWHLDIYEPKQYIDEAVTVYQRALEINLNSPIIHFKIGTAFFYKGELDRAINHFTLSIEYDPQMAEAYYMLGKSLAKKDRFVDAIPYLEKAVAYGKLKSAGAHLLLHILKYGSTFKSRINAIGHLFAALAVFPFDLKAQRVLINKIAELKFLPVFVKGYYLERSHRFFDAIEYYSKAIENAPGYLKFYLVLGDAYRSMGKVSDAINEYRMALWIDPLNVSAYKSLCSTYEEMGDYDSAIKTYEALIELHPNDAVYYSNVANILYLKGDLKGAISCYHTAITLNPNKNWTSVIAQTLGFVLQESKENYDAAISAYQSASLLNPNDIDIYINLGSAFYEKGDFANALSAYRAALEIDPDNARVHCNLGYLLWGKGLIEDAIKEYEIAIKLDPTYDIAYNNLGVIYLDDLGRIQKAVEAFENATKFNPNYALAYYNLARAAAIKGDNVEAASLYQVALDLNEYTNELDENEIKSRIDNLFS